MLKNLELLQVYSPQMAEPAKRAIRLAALLAADMGAVIYCSGSPPTDLGNGFYDIADETIIDTDPADWQAAESETCRLVLRVNDHTTLPGVSVSMPAWETETTLFAGSGLSHLLGDPERAPLVPHGAFAAHTLGYTIFAALVGSYVQWQRFGETDCARLDGVSALAWINWKATVNAAFDEHICRQGKLAEWPVAQAKDGFVAFVYNIRDWEQVVEMIDDDELRSEKFATFEGRMKNAATYLNLARAYFADKSKDALRDEFIARSIPSFPVTDLDDLSADPLLSHRGTIENRNGSNIVRAPYRIEALGDIAQSAAITETATTGLPLAGMRVLDLGMITAGAGVSAMLADMGSEVIKIETAERPDPFRIWPGHKGDDGDAPVFKSNNRNKLGLAVDLKTEDGLAQFMKLVESSDVVLENFRRGVVERLGIGFDALQKVNPRIVLASISSQGSDGPGANHTTFGSTLEASSGFASLTHYDDGVPVISGRNLNYPDQIVCLIGGGVIAAAVAEARQTGQGRHVDVSQRDCAIYQIGDVVAAGAKPVSDIGSAMVRLSDAQWYGVSGVSADALTKMSPAEAEAHCTARGGGIRKVASGQDLLDEKALWEKQIWMRSQDGALVKGFPFQYVKRPMTIYANSPKVGEHTARFI